MSPYGPALELADGEALGLPRDWPVSLGLGASRTTV
jgi:hypothetical protein